MGISNRSSVLLRYASLAMLTLLLTTPTAVLAGAGHDRGGGSELLSPWLRWLDLLPYSAWLHATVCYWWTTTTTLMTAFSSALGMVPLVIGSGAGKEILQPLAVVVLGGLFTSTALTLLVLPALYSLFCRFLVPKKIPQIQDVEVTQGAVI